MSLRPRFSPPLCALCFGLGGATRGAGHVEEAFDAQDALAVALEQCEHPPVEGVEVELELLALGDALPTPVADKCEGLLVEQLQEDARELQRAREEKSKSWPGWAAQNGALCGMPTKSASSRPMAMSLVRSTLVAARRAAAPLPPRSALSTPRLRRAFFRIVAAM